MSVLESVPLEAESGVEVKVMARYEQQITDLLVRKPRSRRELESRIPTLDYAAYNAFHHAIKALVRSGRVTRAGKKFVINNHLSRR